jgi:predicted ester cyclase
VPATGKSLRFTSCDIFRVAGGKIVEHWGMGDIAGVLAQIKG